VNRPAPRSGSRRSPVVSAATSTAEAALPTTAQRHAVLGVLARFVSCGALGVGGGFAWRFSVAPSRIGVASSLAAVLSFLVGFIVGGLAWYARDLRLRRQGGDRISDERMVFSFVVFAAIPFAVLLLVGLVWLLSLAVG
jgi:hypothetical protein